MKEEIKKVCFVCNSCNGELELVDNGIKQERESDPYQLGYRIRRRKISKATCKKCGKITDDYFGD